MTQPCLYFLSILLILQIRGDGYFPFPKTWNLSFLVFVVAIHTAALMFATYRLFMSLVYPNLNYQSDNTFRIQISQPHQIEILKYIFPLLISLICALQFLQFRYFSSIGYRWDPLVVCAGVVIALIPWCVWAIQSSAIVPHYKKYFLSLFWATFVMKIIPILLFPVTAFRSDMLPILQEAGQALLNKESPYQFFVLENGVVTPNVRLPGLILSYLPSVFFSFDPRWITILCEMGVFYYVYVLWKKTSEELQWEKCFAITMFFLLPYWHGRHELYEPPFWILLCGAFVLLQPQAIFDQRILTKYNFCFRPNIALIVVSLLYGTMIAHHQWAWLFAPFFAIWVYHHYGIKKSIFFTVCVNVVGFTVLSILMRTSFHDFFDHIFGTYARAFENKTIYPMSLYWTYALWVAGLKSLLLPIQVLMQIILWIIAFRHGQTLPKFLAILAVSLTVQLLFNPVGWTYQYLLVCLLFLLSLCYDRSRKDSQDSKVYSGGTKVF